MSLPPPILDTKHPVFDVRLYITKKKNLQTFGVTAGHYISDIDRTIVIFHEAAVTGKQHMCFTTYNKYTYRSGCREPSRLGNRYIYIILYFKEVSNEWVKSSVTMSSFNSLYETYATIGTK